MLLDDESKKLWQDLRSAKLNSIKKNLAINPDGILPTLKNMISKISDDVIAPIAEAYYEQISCPCRDSYFINSMISDSVFSCPWCKRDLSHLYPPGYRPEQKGEK